MTPRKEEVIIKERIDAVGLVSSEIGNDKAVWGWMITEATDRCHNVFTLGRKKYLTHSSTLKHQP